MHFPTIPRMFAVNTFFRKAALVLGSRPVILGLLFSIFDWLTYSLFRIVLPLAYFSVWAARVEIMICQAWFSYNHLQESDSKASNKETEHTFGGEAQDSGHNHDHEHSAFGLFRSALFLTSAHFALRRDVNDTPMINSISER
jgi:hypothetical protein